MQESALIHGLSGDNLALRHLGSINRPTCPLPALADHSRLVAFYYNQDPQTCAPFTELRRHRNILAWYNDSNVISSEHTASITFLVRAMAEVTPTPIRDRFLNKVCFITGGGGAIGLCTAIRFVKEGARVVLVDVSPETLAAAEERIAAALPSSVQLQDRLLILQADVTSEADVAKTFEETLQKWGRLDCAFLNVGVSYAAKSLFDTSEEEYDRVMRINVKSGMSTFIYSKSDTNAASLSHSQTCCLRNESPVSFRGKHHPHFLNCRPARQPGPVCVFDEQVCSTRPWPVRRCRAGTVRHSRQYNPSERR